MALDYSKQVEIKHNEHTCTFDGELQGSIRVTNDSATIRINDKLVARLVHSIDNNHLLRYPISKGDVIKVTNSSTYTNQDDWVVVVPYKES